jgi:hypothetical protein
MEDPDLLGHILASARRMNTIIDDLLRAKGTFCFSVPSFSVPSGRVTQTDLTADQPPHPKVRA